MADIWKPQTIEVYQAWVDALKDESSERLSFWEIGFIESINEQLSRGRNLTERQADTLEKIYSEKTN